MHPDSSSGRHQHTFSQITHQTSKTHNSQVTAKTRDVQYQYALDMVAPCSENIHVHIDYTVDQPDTTGQSHLHS